MIALSGSLSIMQSLLVILLNDLISLGRGLMNGIESLLKQQDLSLPLSTAQGVTNVPFQRWFKFKEAFSPKFVHDIIQKSMIKVDSILDPFGGSGTTALTSQMMGINSTTIEVNPFLADLIESKLCEYQIDQLIEDWVSVSDRVNSEVPSLNDIYRDAPKTLFESNDVERWIFNREIIYRIAQYREAIGKITDKKTARLFSVLLGSILIPFSNVMINGKGRRYRKNWEVLSLPINAFDEALRVKVEEAIFDIVRYSKIKSGCYDFFFGDSRSVLGDMTCKQDLIVFSPPYPNSFDYTDIYNVELWALGYLNSATDNKILRSNTLRSHVQIKMNLSPMPESKTLSTTLESLDDKVKLLWNKNIPSMVNNYFYDLNVILENSMRLLNNNGMAVIVIGDSKYVDIKIDTAKITCELARNIGFTIRETQEIRVMKSSAQQGWSKNLSETAIFLGKDN